MISAQRPSVLPGTIVRHISLYLQLERCLKNAFLLFPPFGGPHDAAATTFAPFNIAASLRLVWLTK